MWCRRSGSIVGVEYVLGYVVQTEIVYHQHPIIETSVLVVATCSAGLTSKLPLSPVSC